MARRLAALLLVPIYLALSAWWLSGLAGQAAVAVPGGGAGDNLTFVWNTWWMARVLETGAPFFFSPMVFAPFGVDLTLHTHTALPSFAAAAFASPASLVLRTNLAIGVQLALNFLCAFVLARRVTRDVPAAILGSIVFGWSPYLGSHLPGHFNLIGAWLLPLSAWLSMVRLEDRTRAAGPALGALLGAAPYVDYYYAVYACVLLAVFVLQRNLGFSRAEGVARRTWQRRALAGIAGLWLVVFIIVAGIAITGGGVFTVGSRSVSMLSVANPVALLGILTMAAALVAFVPGVRARLDARGVVADVSALALPLAIAAVLALPLLVHAVALWQHGDYVTQKYFWRSAPRGVDVATLLLGNPAGLLTHGLVTRAYTKLGIDAVEQVAWLGPGVIALSAAAVAFRKTHAGVRVWLAVTAVFGVWALGPSLAAFGHDTHVILPGVLVRYLPIVANARIPARAAVLVYLSAAVLAAIGVAELRRRGRTRLVAILAALVLVDYLPRPVPVFRLDRPAPYEELARRADQGILCELPMGLRDGFGETGRLDSRVLAYQMIHGHPITGGFVARLSPKLLDAYDRSPVLGVLLRLSGGKPLAGETVLSGAAAGDALRSAGIRYVMVNKLTAPADLATYIHASLPLHILSEDAERVLYEVR